VKTDGSVVLPALAGVYGQGLDFSRDYDPAANHPAGEIEIPTSPGFPATAGAEGFLAIDANDDLYITSLRVDNYVVKVSCAK